jgi:tetratricopeptide (TPR) repeat protein
MRRVAVAVMLVAAAGLVGGTASAEDYLGAFLRGAKLAKQRNYPKALEAFQDAIRLDPTQVDAYLNAGNIAKHLDKCREVLLHYRGLLYLSPGDPDAKSAKAAIAACEAKGAGTLIVKTSSLADAADVTGVEVTLADGLVGRTPVPDLKLAPGTYRMELTHPDFEPVTEDVTITAGATTEVKRDLKKKLLYGALEVKTEPADGVVVYIDDVQVGVTPLKEKLKLETKKYLVRFEKPGYDRWIRNVTIQRDRTTTVSATLEPTVPAGPDEPTPPGGQ